MSNPTSNFGWVMPTATDLVTDLPADFNVFGQAVDTSMADLKGGTTGQILAKATNTDMDFTWVTNDVGDITAVTAGTGISGGGTSGAVTVSIDTAVTADLSTAQTMTNKTLTTPKISNYTTAGDLVYGTGSSVISRLGIGTAGQVLQVNSGATAPEWATPAAAGGMTLLSTTTLTSSSVTISSISQSYKHLFLVLQDVAMSADSNAVEIRCNGDTGSNYVFSRIRVINTTVAGAGSTSATSITITGGNTATSTASLKGASSTWLYRYTDTTQQQISSLAFQNQDSTPAFWNIVGKYMKSAAVTSITLFTSTGTFTGTAYLYGVN